MISEEKIGHILHLMLDGIEKAGMVTYPDKDMAVREGRKICFQYVSQLMAVADAALERITSQKNAPPQYSPQFEVLYQKYYEEEMKKRGG